MPSAASGEGTVEERLTELQTAARNALDALLDPRHTADMAADLARKWLEAALR